MGRLLFEIVVICNYNKKKSCHYLFESMHAENGPVVGFDSLHQEHVPPDANVTSARA